MIWLFHSKRSNNQRFLYDFLGMRIDRICDVNQSELEMTNGEGILKNQPRELTPQNDVKKVISEVLKRVDGFIRKGELDQAEHCVLQAREIDPKNIYAYAFQERITILKDQVYQNSLAAAACNASEETKRIDQVCIQTNTNQSQRGQPKPQSKPLPVSQMISKNLPAAASKKDAEPKLMVKVVPKLNSIETAQKEQPTAPHAPMIAPQTNGQQQADSQSKINEERNLKIQRMIKIAVDSVRKEVESKQMEIRTKERAEFERRELVRIKEASETARKDEEQRQTEIRKKTEEELQRKIRETLQRNPVMDIFTVPQHPVPDSSVVPSKSDYHVAPLPTAGCPMSAERKETLERYRLVLSSVWADGSISEEEISTLKQLRESLSISSEEHARLEKEVQRETYIEAFKKAWHSGTATPENASVLDELRQRFQISNEEHLAIESGILSEIQPTINRPMLLIIDDDERLLKVVSKTLIDAGFITTPVTTSDEAYAYLKECSPDLILCDVNLETSTMGGFAFYEKVREFERLRDTPFIFLSALTDEALVRTGKELGVDDYLSKPVSEETLVATIKGKLRRYHELKKRMN
jgi:CheY-like chemotaxis protein